MVTRSIQLTDAHELQKILPDTTRHVTVHLNNEFFISSVSAFGSDAFSCAGNYFNLVSRVLSYLALGNSCPKSIPIFTLPTCLLRMLCCESLHSDRRLGKRGRQRFAKWYNFEFYCILLFGGCFDILQF